MVYSPHHEHLFITVLSNTSVTKDIKVKGKQVQILLMPHLLGTNRRLPKTSASCPYREQDSQASYTDIIMQWNLIKHKNGSKPNKHFRSNIIYFVHHLIRLLTCN